MSSHNWYENDLIDPSMDNIDHLYNDNECDDDDDNYINDNQTGIEQGISLESSKLDSSALSQYYNKEEKRSTFSDIKINVQTQSYHLDKTILALKSAYFETLFTAEFEDKKYDEIEIYTIDEDTFSSIVDYIYGADLYKQVLNERNFATLFMAMDYLQMEIDLITFENFLTRGHELDNRIILQLHDYVSLLPELESITTAIRVYLSNNLREVSNSMEFLSLAPAALIEILSANVYKYYPKMSLHYIDGICVESVLVEWICHDFQKRLPHVVDLVNAIKSRFEISLATGGSNYREFVESDETSRKERLKKYIKRLLYQCAEISPAPIVTGTGTKKYESYEIITKMHEYISTHKINYAAKWRAYFKQQTFCDVSIRVGDEFFQLHRIQLSLEIPYFRDLLSRSPNQNEYVLEAAIEGETFRKIVNYIYYEELDLTNESQIGRLLRSCEILQMEDLKKIIYQYVVNSLNSRKGIVFDFLSFIIEKEEFCEYRHALEMFIETAWEKICREPEFRKTSIDVLEYVVNLPNLRLKNERGLLNICSEWIHYDVKNRYQFIPKLALAINRSSEIDFEKYKSALGEDLCSAASVQQIEREFINILCSTQLVSTRTILADDLAEELIPHFIVIKREEISIVNADFGEITSIPLLNQEYSAGEPKPSAAIVNDNLFMLFAQRNKFSFQALNFRSKKVTSLNFNFKIKSLSFQVVNYNNKPYYFCNGCNDHEDYVWKYSVQLNRWIRHFKNEPQPFQLFMTSNGILYRVFMNLNYKYEAQSYEFEKKTWTKLADLPRKTKDSRVVDVSIIDGNFAILFDYCTTIYQEEIQKWKLISHRKQAFIAFKQFKNSIIYVKRKCSSCIVVNSIDPVQIEFHSFSMIDKKWEIKKEVQMTYYDTIVPVV